MTKKFLSSLLAVFIVFASFNVGFAEEGISVSAARVQGSKGDKVNVPITLSNNTGFGDLELEIAYDSSALKLEGVSANSNVGCIFTPAQNISANPFNISWSSTDNNSYNGVLASLCFEILTDTPGVYPLNISFFKGKDGNNVDGVDINYAYGGKDMQDFVPLKLKYNHGYVQVGNILSSDLTVNVSINDMKYTKKLVPLYKSAGFVSVISYDKNDCIIDIKACPAEPNVSIDLGDKNNADYLKIILWENMINMKPISEIQKINI